MRIVVILPLFLAACGQTEPRSVQYFESHLEEARQVVTDCRSGAARGAECDHAEVAVETAKGRDRMKRFLGKD